MSEYLSINSLYSLEILSCSRPVKRCRRRSRIACACVVDSRYWPSVEARLLGEILGARRSGAGALEHRRHGAGPPALRAQRGARVGRRRRALDELDDLVDVRERDHQAFQDVRALARLAQVEQRAARDDLAPVAQEGLEQLLQRQQLRLAVDEADHVDAEDALQRRLLEEVVQHDVRELAALELDDDAHAVLVGLVAQLADAFELLLAHELGDALDEPRLVNLVRQLRDDDRFAIAAVAERLDVRAAAHVDAAAPGRVRADDALDAVDQPGRREIRAPE